MALLAFLLIAKVTLGVLYEYRNYFPPDFESEFLRGRESYFWGMYRWAFYTHLVSGPTTLVAGTILVASGSRPRTLVWHRRVGWAEVACVLLLLVPSGLWMARYAMSGMVAAAGLAVLAVLTAVSVACGARAAWLGRISQHQLWMWRTYILICSAIVIRVLGGLATVMHWSSPRIYAFSTWASWLVPLLLFELMQIPPIRGKLISPRARR
jgi:hypothetical protein